MTMMMTMVIILVYDCRCSACRTAAGVESAVNSVTINGCLSHEKASPRNGSGLVWSFSGVQPASSRVTGKYARPVVAIAGHRQNVLLLQIATRARAMR